MINCTVECSSPLGHCILGMLISHIFIRTIVWVRKSHWQFYSNLACAFFPEGMEQTLLTSLCPTLNFFPQVINMSEKTGQYTSPALSLDSSPLKSLTGKANDSQILADHAQQFYHKPTGALLKICPRAFCLFHLGCRLSWGGQDTCWTSEASVHRESSHPCKNSAHVTRWGAEQRVCCLEVSSWNAGCLATRSCLSPTSILRALA